MFPAGARKRVLASLIAFFDESGPHGGPNDVFTLAGIVATDHKWDRVEASWDKRLKHRVFHMVDFENRKGAFENWPSEKGRIPLIASLADSLRGNIGFAVAHSVIYRDFRDVFCPNATHKKTLRFAYGVLLLSCLGDIIDKVVRHMGPNSEVISFACEELSGVEGFATDCFHEFKRRGGLDSAFGTIAFWPKDRFRGLQAADMLAYENFKHVTTQFERHEQRPVRRLFMALDQTQRIEAGYYNRERLVNLQGRLTTLQLWPPKNL